MLYALTIPKELGIYIPLGILGLIRWLAWLFKRVPATFYKPYTSDFRADLTVISPVYQEDTEILTAAINSWLANRAVQEVICVVDYTDTNSIEVVQGFTARGDKVRLIVTEVPGKRDALRRGWETASTDIVALVDSDTIWSSDVAELVVQPFADPDIAGVGTRQNVLNPTTVWERLNDFYLDYRYFDEAAAQTVMGRAVSCLSGRTAVYRRRVLLQISDQFMNERWMGVTCNSGEDKRLTSLVLERGYHTFLQRSARVWSTFPKRGTTFFKQRLRWSRNTWRSDLRAMMRGWVWRHPFLSFTMLDKAVSSFTLLVSPIFLGIALVNGHWKVALALVLWWFVSRGAKHLPHLERRKRDILLIPLFILVSFAMAIVKIYALLTMRRQRWLTRDVAVIDGELQRTFAGAGKVATPAIAKQQAGS